MRQLLAIARRETVTFFHSAIAPVVLFGFLLLVGLFFTLFVFGFSQLCFQAVKSGHISANLNLAEAVFQPLVADMAIFLLFLLPAVGMRLFAEEYRSGRYDLVMSYPVSDEIWVAGKWLSVMAATVVLLLAASLYFVITAWLGHPEPGPLVAAAIGLLLLGGVIAVWSLFFSTLFQYQVVSYFLAFAFCLLLYSIDALAPYLPGGLERLVTELSFKEHFVRFSWGVVDVKDRLADRPAPGDPAPLLPVVADPGAGGAGDGDLPGGPALSSFLGLDAQQALQSRAAERAGAGQPGQGHRDHRLLPASGSPAQGHRGAAARLHRALAARAHHHGGSGSGAVQGGGVRRAGAADRGDQPGRPPQGPAGA
jgi:ABC-2 type transport system permease protein